MEAIAHAAGRELRGVIASAAAGDEVAFARIVAAYHEDMRRVCVFVARDEALDPVLFTGEGDYEGLSAYVLINFDTGGLPTFSGVIFRATCLHSRTQQPSNRSLARLLLAGQRTHIGPSAFGQRDPLRGDRVAPRHHRQLHRGHKEQDV